MEDNYNTFDGNSREARRGHDDNCGYLICCAFICTLIGCFGLLYVTGHLSNQAKGEDNGNGDLFVETLKHLINSTKNITNVPSISHSI